MSASDLVCVEGFRCGQEGAVDDLDGVLMMLLARHATGVVSIQTTRGVHDLEVAINRATAEGEKAGLTPNEAFSHAANVACVSTADAAAIARRSHAVTWDQTKHDRSADDDLDERHAASVARLVDECIATLTPREADVIRRNVLGDEPLLEIGKTDGVSGEAMRQTKIRAIAKITRELGRRRLTAEDLL